MDDNLYSPRPVAGWFMPAALVSLLVMVLGCVGLIMHLMTDPATLPLDERALFQAEPMWVLAASGIGFVAGALGGLLLVLRRKAAVPLLLIALAGLALWLVGMLATPDFRDLMSTNDIAVVVAIVLVAWTIYWFARHSRQRGWLR